MIDNPGVDPACSFEASVGRSPSARRIRSNSPTTPRLRQALRGRAPSLPRMSTRDTMWPTNESSIASATAVMTARLRSPTSFSIALSAVCCFLPPAINPENIQDWRNFHYRRDADHENQPRGWHIAIDTATTPPGCTLNPCGTSVGFASLSSDAQVPSPSVTSAIGVFEWSTGARRPEDHNGTPEDHNGTQLSSQRRPTSWRQMCHEIEKETKENPGASKTSTDSTT